MFEQDQGPDEPLAARIARAQKLLAQQSQEPPDEPLEKRIARAQKLLAEGQVSAGGAGGSWDTPRKKQKPNLGGGAARGLEVTPDPVVQNAIGDFGLAMSQGRLPQGPGINLPGVDIEGADKDLYLGFGPAEKQQAAFRKMQAFASGAGETHIGSPIGKFAEGVEAPLDMTGTEKVLQQVGKWGVPIVEGAGADMLIIRTAASIAGTAHRMAPTAEKFLAALKASGKTRFAAEAALGGTSILATDLAAGERDPTRLLLDAFLGSVGGGVAGWGLPALGRKVKTRFNADVDELVPPKVDDLDPDVEVAAGDEAVAAAQASLGRVPEIDVSQLEKLTADRDAILQLMRGPETQAALGPRLSEIENQIRQLTGAPDPSAPMTPTPEVQLPTTVVPRRGPAFPTDAPEGRQAVDLALQRSREVTGQPLPTPKPPNVSEQTQQFWARETQMAAERRAAQLASQQQADVPAQQAAPVAQPEAPVPAPPRVQPPVAPPAGDLPTIRAQYGDGPADALLEIGIEDPTVALPFARGFADAQAGKPLAEGADGAYNSGYNLAKQKAIESAPEPAQVEKPAKARPTRRRNATPITPEAPVVIRGKAVPVRGIAVREALASEMKGAEKGKRGWVIRNARSGEEKIYSEDVLEIDPQAGMAHRAVTEVMAGLGIGAGAGAVSDPENPKRGAAIGAAAGASAPTLGRMLFSRLRAFVTRLPAKELEAHVRLMMEDPELAQALGSPVDRETFHKYAGIAARRIALTKARPRDPGDWASDIVMSPMSLPIRAGSAALDLVGVPKKSWELLSDSELGNPSLGGRWDFAFNQKIIATLKELEDQYSAGGARAPGDAGINELVDEELSRQGRAHLRPDQQIDRLKKSEPVAAPEPDLPESEPDRLRRLAKRSASQGDLQTAAILEIRAKRAELETTDLPEKQKRAVLLEFEAEQNDRAGWHSLAESSRKQAATLRAELAAEPGGLQGPARRRGAADPEVVATMARSGIGAATGAAFDAEVGDDDNIGTGTVIGLMVGALSNPRIMRQLVPELRKMFASGKNLDKDLTRFTDDELLELAKRAQELNEVEVAVRLREEVARRRTKPKGLTQRLLVDKDPTDDFVDGSAYARAAPPTEVPAPKVSDIDVDSPDYWRSPRRLIDMASDDSLELNDNWLRDTVRFIDEQGPESLPDLERMAHEALLDSEVSSPRAKNLNKILDAIYRHISDSEKGTRSMEVKDFTGMSGLMDPPPPRDFEPPRPYDPRDDSGPGYRPDDPEEDEWLQLNDGNTRQYLTWKSMRSPEAKDDFEMLSPDTRDELLDWADGVLAREDLSNDADEFAKKWAFELKPDRLDPSDKSGMSDILEGRTLSDAESRAIDPTQRKVMPGENYYRAVNHLLWDQNQGGGITSETIEKVVREFKLADDHQRKSIIGRLRELREYDGFESKTFADWLEANWNNLGAVAAAPIGAAGAEAEEGSWEQKLGLGMGVMLGLRLGRKYTADEIAQRFFDFKKVNFDAVKIKKRFFSPGGSFEYLFDTTRGPLRVTMSRQPGNALEIHTIEWADAHNAQDTFEQREIGPAAVRSLYTQLLGEHPWARLIYGKRMTGTRGARATRDVETGDMLDGGRDMIQQHTIPPGVRKVAMAYFSDLPAGVKQQIKDWDLDLRQGVPDDPDMPPSRVEYADDYDPTNRYFDQVAEADEIESADMLIRQAFLEADPAGREAIAGWVNEQAELGGVREYFFGNTAEWMADNVNLARLPSGEYPSLDADALVRNGWSTADVIRQMYGEVPTTPRYAGPDEAQGQLAALPFAPAMAMQAERALSSFEEEKEDIPVGTAVGVAIVGGLLANSKVSRQMARRVIRALHPNLPAKQAREKAAELMSGGAQAVREALGSQFTQYGPHVNGAMRGAANLATTAWLAGRLPMGRAKREIEDKIVRNMRAFVVPREELVSQFFKDIGAGKNPWTTPLARAESRAKIQRAVESVAGVDLDGNPIYGALDRELNASGRREALPPQVQQAIQNGTWNNLPPDEQVKWAKASDGVMEYNPKESEQLWDDLTPEERQVAIRIVSPEHAAWGLRAEAVLRRTLARGKKLREAIKAYEDFKANAKSSGIGGQVMGSEARRLSRNVKIADSALRNDLDQFSYLSKWARDAEGRGIVQARVAHELPELDEISRETMRTVVSNLDQNIEGWMHRRGFENKNQAYGFIRRLRKIVAPVRRHRRGVEGWEDDVAASMHDALLSLREESVRNRLGTELERTATIPAAAGQSPPDGYKEYTYQFGPAKGKPAWINARIYEDWLKKTEESNLGPSGKATEAKGVAKAYGESVSRLWTKTQLVASQSIVNNLSGSALIALRMAQQLSDFKLKRAMRYPAAMVQNLPDFVREGLPFIQPVMNRPNYAGGPALRGASAASRTATGAAIGGAAGVALNPENPVEGGLKGAAVGAGAGQIGAMKLVRGLSPEEFGESFLEQFARNTPEPLGLKTIHKATDLALAPFHATDVYLKRVLTSVERLNAAEDVVAKMNLTPGQKSAAIDDLIKQDFATPWDTKEKISSLASNLMNQIDQIDRQLSVKPPLPANVSAPLLAQRKSLDVALAQAQKDIGVQQKQLQAVQDVADSELKERSYYAPDYSVAPQWLNSAQRSSLGMMTSPYLKWSYFYGRTLHHHLIEPILDESAPMRKRLSSLAAFIELTLPFYYWGIKSEEQSDAMIVGKEEAESGVDYALDRSGRSNLSLVPVVGRAAHDWLDIDPNEHELQMRTVKYPIADVAQMASAVRERNPEALNQAIREKVTVGPLLQAGALAAGYRSKYNVHKEPSAVAGELARSFVPGHRIIEDVGKMRWPVAYRPESFKEGLLGDLQRALPIVGGEAGAEKGSYGRTRQYRSGPGPNVMGQNIPDPVIYDPKLAALQAILGINLRAVPRTEAQWERAQLEFNKYRREAREEIREDVVEPYLQDRAVDRLEQLRQLRDFNNKVKR